MKYNLYENNGLISFFNELFSHEEYTNFAPNIMKFFIITRNYGLIDIENNINRIMNGENLISIINETIQKGFQMDKISFTEDSLISFVINNYHENGFYFHSFPGVYKDSIRQNGLLATQRNKNDEKFYEIVRKYHFGEYFSKSNNRVCVTEMLDNFSTHEYAFYTPEWLEMFLKMGYGDFQEEYRRGDMEEILDITAVSLKNIQKMMKEVPNYDENDYHFLVDYIKSVVVKRFASGNNEVGILLIPKKESVEYFGKYLNLSDKEALLNFAKSQSLKPFDIINLLVNNMVKGEVVSEKNIPNNLLGIVSYNVPFKNSMNKSLI